MFQIGEEAESSNYSDNCGTGLTVVYVEYFVSGSSNGICPKTSAINAFGDGGLFAVAGLERLGGLPEQHFLLQPASPPFLKRLEYREG
jgi:hypothetical protein